MKLSALLVFLFTEFVANAVANVAHQRKLCSNRCHRLLKRSLERNEQADTVEEILYRTIAYSRQQIVASLEQQQADAASSAHFVELPEPLRNICWKFFDFEDCSTQCDRAFFRHRKGKSDKKTDAIGQEQRMVLQFCHQNNFGVPTGHFACIHKFHAFVEIRCFSYQQKAVQLRLMALQFRRQMSVDEPPPPSDIVKQYKEGNAPLIDDADHSNAIDQEVCLLLHQHSTCLGNAMGRHCPFARALLFANRHALRDNFLSFVLPFGTAMERNANAEQSSGANLDGAIELDRLFSEEMLDMCQLLDFNRMAAQWHGSDEEQKDRLRGTTKRAAGPEGTTERAVLSATSARRRLFSSDEDLLDIPPNFHYSSARLPPDFHTRYAICRAQQPAHSTLVQLLPEAMPMTAQSDDRQPTWPHTTTTPSAIAVRQTWPDPMLNTQQLTDTKETMLLEESDNVQNAASLPYLINGRATVPQSQWTTEGTTVGRRTEIRLLDDDDNDGQRRRTGAAKTSAQTMPTATTTHPLNTNGGPQRHNWPPNDEAEGRDGKMPTTKNARGNGTDKAPTAVTEHPAHLGGDANNVYFAKILHFDEENGGHTATAAGDSGGAETAQVGRVTAYMEHFPREQLEPVQQKVETDQSLEADQDVSSAEDYFYEDDQSDEDDEGDRLGVVEHGKASEERHNSPYEISTASWGSSRPPTPSSAARPRIADLSPKSRAPLDIHRRPSISPADGLGRIVVTAERLPAGDSDVLLVLLGLYGTFFGVAAFLLLCLLLACLERRRRRHGALLLGRYRRKYCLNSNAKKGGSAILYLDERLGTVKCVSGGK